MDQFIVMLTPRLRKENLADAPMKSDLSGLRNYIMD